MLSGWIWHVSKVATTVRYLANYSCRLIQGELREKGSIWTEQVPLVHHVNSLALV